MQDVLGLHAAEVWHVIIEEMSITGMHNFQMFRHVTGAECANPTLFALDANPQVTPTDMCTYLARITSGIITFPRSRARNVK